MLWITLHTVLLSTVMWRIVLFYYYLVHQDKANNTNQSSASLKFCRGFSFPRNFSRQLPLSNWRSCFCICACFCLLCSFKSYLVFYFVLYRMFLFKSILINKASSKYLLFKASRGHSIKMQLFKRYSSISIGELSTW